MDRGSTSSKGKVSWTSRCISRFPQRRKALLARGIVPLEHQQTEQVLTIADLVGDYEREAHPSPKDVASLKTILPVLGTVRLTEINAAWVDQ